VPQRAAVVLVVVQEPMPVALRLRRHTAVASGIRLHPR
jgi:hypothetical protein